MPFTGKHSEVVYIMVSIKIHIGKGMDSGHYVCDVLDYNTGTWYNFDDGIIIHYSVYSENVYDNLSNENEPKRGEILMWMDQIGLCQCYI